MGSKDQEVRLRQLARAEARLAQRKTELQGRGLDARAVKRDATLRRLNAEVQKAKLRVEARQAAKSHVEQVAAKIAAQGKPKPTEKKAKKPKKDAAPAGGKDGGKPAKGTKGTKGSKKK